MKRETLVFNYYGMKNVGGIEKYIDEVVGELLKLKVRIIWLKEKNSKVAQSFKINMLESNVEIINVTQRGYHWFALDPITFSEEEEISIVSFSPIDMGRALYLAKIYSSYNIKLLYAIPNTTGNTYYVERYFKGFIKKRVAKRMRILLKKWEDSGALAFFSYGQIKPLEDAYNFQISNKRDKILPYAEEMPDLDEKKLIKRAKRDPFKIITVGRFDFPHKGYMLGLIEIFGKLKKIYPTIKLDIIGFGPDEDKVKNKIAELDDLVQKDIRLLGEVAPKDLTNYFDEASLNIGVANSIFAGVKSGVLSLPARNYCYEGCEVYGFLPENKEMTTSTSPGKSAEEFIRRVIDMPADEYISICQQTYEAYKKDYNVNPHFFLERGCKAEDILYNSDIRFLKIMHYLTKILDYIRIKR